ncbi:EAL domain-containing protein [Mobilibacterium timonense]|uniref:EAL domain-containing protein n=1 Tax=Mobilibacterium timonense TaxID=1871012 RepID=UPI0009846799|nr:EAL domain-containing protein [Mobilibacterium timonense]
MESLARWIKKDGTVVQPGEFIPILEEDHLIHLLDLAMLDRILEDELMARARGVKLP